MGWVKMVGTRQVTVLVCLLMVSSVLVGCVSDENGETPGDDDGMADADAHERIMETARTVAEGLNTPEKAREAGFEPHGPCVPGMGVHWVNPDRLDTNLDPEEPEVVLFRPDDANLSDTSGDEFMAIEYVVVTEGTDRNSTDNVPELHGVPFYGPMEGHEPGQPWHAELHVYLAEGLESNASFPQMNPGIECPDGSTPQDLQLLGMAREVADGLDTPEEAREAGYHPASVCENGMGVHWVNMGAFDTELNASQPEVVMFHPSEEGIYDIAGQSFVGIEYVVVTEGTDQNSTETVPTLEGRSFDGPMPGHFPGMPYHAELHLYLAPQFASAPFGHAEEHEPFGMNHHVDLECPEGTQAPPMASATLNGTPQATLDGSTGNVSITEGPFVGTLGITVEVENLSEGEHGVHIHEGDNCDPVGEGPVGAGGAGGHFNPDNASHGNHSGDLGNIVVGSDGTGTLMVEKSPLTLETNATYGVDGRALVVHQNEDDGETDPGGNSGPAVLCGVIGAS